MIVTLRLTAATRRRIDADVARAERLAAALADGLEQAALAGADAVREQLVLGRLDLTMRHPGQGGLASGVTGWMLDRDAPVAAIGVRSTHPAWAYAGIHEHGGTIVPRRARMLAIPVSEEARLYSSPRDMTGLVLIRRGDRCLLARPLGSDAIEVHWVLVRSVTIQPTRWLSRGVERARSLMAGVLQRAIDLWMKDAE